MAYAIGPDVSFYKDDDTTPEGIDFEKMKNRSDFVIIRVGQNLWIDSDFKRNWEDAKKAGLPRGSYWFYDSRVEPQRQAELWRDALGDDLGELPLFADFEDHYDGPYKGWQKWYAFLEYVKNMIPGKEIFIYTGYYYWKENGPNPNTQASSLEYFHQYPLWIANYNDVPAPNVPAPWGEDEWLFWQYTENGDGRAYGAESAGIDLNYFNGDAEAFRARFNLSDPPPSAAEKFKVDLSLREGPGVNFAAVGILEHDEIVEKLDVSDDGSWLKVKRSNGDVGWSVRAHLIPEDSEIEPDPLKPWAKVLPATLNVRLGAGAAYAVVGTLTQNQVVKVLEANDDQSWIKIVDEESADNLTGWCDASYLLLLDEPPDDGDDEPEPEEKWYRVNVYALNVRKGPSTQYEVEGTVVQDEVVERIEVDETGRWFKIRNVDGLVGWVFASYLVETEAPDDVDDGNDDDGDDGNGDDDDNGGDGGGDDDDIDIPQYEFLGRFQVTAYSLNVRQGPGTENPAVGSVKKGDIVNAVDATDDGSWRKIEKGDLEGWVSAQYLVRYPQPTPVNQKYFNKKVRYIREIRETPRKMIVHVMVLDTFYEKMNFLVTPPDHNVDAAPICARTTSEFLEEFGVQIAINGDGYSHVDADSVPGVSCPEGRDLLDPNSYAASQGRVYSQRMNADRPIMYINRKGKTSFDKLNGVPYNAISGDRWLVEGGNIPAGLDDTVLEPRTAVGVNENGRWMLLIVVDGRQPGYSEGCTLKELAQMLIDFGGAYNAINLDGGGSSAMVLQKDGKAEVLNSPIEGGIAGRQRYVANHLGVLIE